MRSPDLLRYPTDPLRDALRATLTASGLTGTQATALVDLVDVAGIAVVAVLVAPVAARLYARADRATAGDRWRLVAALAAGALLWWIVRHPSRNIFEFLIRWDHLAFTALAGGILAAATPALRLWVLALLNVVVMWQYLGTVATPIVLGAIVMSFAALGLRGGTAAAALGLLGTTVYATCWYLRSAYVNHGVLTFGLFSLIFLRQISAAIGVAGSARPAFGHYLCYLTFYPGGFGPVSGPEVYSEFARRNFGARLHYDPRRAARSVAWGALQIWAAYRVPATIADLHQSTTTLELWQNSLLVFVRSALFGMGLWAISDALAVFHGFRLHPSFRGILTRQNPTELWWAWRGAFTNWLVRHVYGPLAARQHGYAVGIVAAFAVSWGWHVLGVPFVTRRLSLTLLSVVPITAWALVNAAAVIGHRQARTRRLRILPAATPPLVRRIIHIFLTACLGSFSVSFLSYQADPAARFFPFLRLLAGLGP
jgi:hypothetical protein